MEKIIKNVKEHKAITLIALVITVVVLVILGAIAISLSLSNNGIFNRAKTAGELYTNAQEHEKDVVSSDIVIGNRNVSESEMIDLIKEYGTPVGTVISLMGNSAPDWYLPCDGTTYNIADYPELANYFEEEFGSKNYFGGDGTTTFKVPDLQGEFLRGTGTNGHSGQGNGETVGTHQSATKVTVAGTDSSNNSTLPYYGTFNKSTIYADYEYTTTTKGRWQGLSQTWNDARNSMYATRPTNTSVLYCIKYK